MSEPNPSDTRQVNQVSATLAGTTVTVHVRGRFDFSCHPGFRNTCASFGSVKNYVVDLANTDYMDSSALGMLLMLRDEAGGANVRIANCGPTVRRILTIANFDSLFSLE